MLVVSLNAGKGQRDSEFVLFIEDANPKSKRILVLGRVQLASDDQDKVRVGFSLPQVVRGLRAGTADSPWEQYVREGIENGWSVHAMNVLQEELVAIYPQPPEVDEAAA